MTSNENRRTFIVDLALEGTRLDKALTRLLPTLSRSCIQKIIRKKHVSIDGVCIDSVAVVVSRGVRIDIKIPLIDNHVIAAENIPLNIVFEDEHLMVVDKPASMVVYPTPTHGSSTLVNALLFRFDQGLKGVGHSQRPGIVHRLDKDTSGLMIVAKTTPAYDGLIALFKRHAIDRTYSAYIWGRPNPLSGCIRAPIGRNKRHRQKMTVVTHGEKTGKDAITHYTTKQLFKNVAAHVECTLETGRTHQIRVHMTTYHHGIIGDKIYGRLPKHCRSTLKDQNLYRRCQKVLQTFNRHALHAKILGFVHPITKKALYFESRLPQDMQKLDFFLKNL